MRQRSPWAGLEGAGKAGRPPPAAGGRVGQAAAAGSGAFPRPCVRSHLEHGGRGLGQKGAGSS